MIWEDDRRRKADVDNQFNKILLERSERVITAQDGSEVTISSENDIFDPTSDAKLVAPMTLVHNSMYKTEDYEEKYGKGSAKMVSWDSIKPKDDTVIQEYEFEIEDMKRKNMTSVTKSSKKVYLGTWNLSFDRTGVYRVRCRAISKDCKSPWSDWCAPVATRSTRIGTDMS